LLHCSRSQTWLSRAALSASNETPNSIAFLIRIFRSVKFSRSSSFVAGRFKRLSLRLVPITLESRLRLTDEDRFLLLKALEVYSKSLPPTPARRQSRHDQVARLVDRLVNTRTGPKFGDRERSYFTRRERYFTIARQKLRHESFSKHGRRGWNGRLPVWHATEE